MSSRYEARFDELRKEKRKAFMPFTVLGWPDRNRSFQLIEQMIGAGVSALELGFAFSDPVADGPLIQRATTETIQSGFSVLDGFELIKKVREIDDNIPIGVLIYFNLILAKGIEKFFQLAKEAGIDGVLIADLPADEADEVLPTAKKYGIDLIFLISPVSPEARIELIAKQASGFLYLLSRLGVTGTGLRSAESDRSLTDLIGTIKGKTRVPVCAGFGISRDTDAITMFNSGADGVISGSRVIELARDAEQGDSLLQQFYAEMMAACSYSSESGKATAFN
jgi:tryptophan synthase alpha chain